MTISFVDIDRLISRIKNAMRNTSAVSYTTNDLLTCLAVYCIVPNTDDFDYMVDCVEEVEKATSFAQSREWVNELDSAIFTAIIHSSKLWKWVELADNAFEDIRHNPLKYWRDKSSELHYFADLLSYLPIDGYGYVTQIREITDQNHTVTIADFQTLEKAIDRIFSEIDGWIK